MSRRWIKEHMKAIYLRYKKASRTEKKDILDEFSKTHGCHRKHAIRLLNGPLPVDSPKRRRRTPLYDATVIFILRTIWEAAGYLWSVRLKAALPLWLPWIKHHFQLTAAQARLLLSISPAQIDRRLAHIKRKLKRRIYGRTKPGTLLKHHIPVKTDCWDVRRPGFLEVDLVSHSGPSFNGLFAYTLDAADIHTTWNERRAILGKDKESIVKAIEEIERSLPFPLLGIDADNGSEFINDLLYAYCQKRKIQFTRGRPYKKNDNAHVEQKNWTHVRQIFGYVRYDTQEAVDAMNALYRGALRLYQNLFQPSVKLKKKIHVGSKIKRVYSKAQTPFNRVLHSKGTRTSRVKELKIQLSQLDPFQLSKTVDQKIKALYQMTLEQQRVSRHQKEILSASPVILVRPGEHQKFKFHGHASKGPTTDLFHDVRFDPVSQLQRRLEREAALSP
jgi:hypothetical protein